MNHLIIRCGATQDADFVHTCTGATYRKYTGVTGREPVPMTLEYTFTLGHFVCWVAGLETAPAALLLLQNPSHDPVIYSVGVLAHTQHRGVSRTLINHAESRLRENDVGHIRLYTRKW